MAETPYALHTGDALEVLRQLPDGCADCCVTSPPYWGLRDYGVDHQIGLEDTYPEYVSRLVQVFKEVHRILRPHGTLWLNLGDSYGRQQGQQHLNRSAASVRGGGHKASLPRYDLARSTGFPEKNLLGIPWRVAFALQEAGWILRSEIIWHKTNSMPESVRDRPSKSHEHVFLLSKRPHYFYNATAIAEGARSAPGIRNARSVWSIATQPFPGAHFAVMPEELARRCLLAGCPRHVCPGCGKPWRAIPLEPTCSCGLEPVPGVAIDPFAGTGTTLAVALQLGLRAVGIELNPEYVALAHKRLQPLGAQAVLLPS